ncbi:expansin B1 [Trifolium repens]|nr:expansin B1 [Trifolium repens]
MSPRAFSKLGRNAVASEKLKKYGVLEVEYKRVPCTYKGNNIVYQINENSNNPGYFAINVLYVGGTYDVTAVEIWQGFLVNSYWLVSWHNHTRGQSHLATYPSVLTVYEIIFFTTDQFTL